MKNNIFFLVFVLVSSFAVAQTTNPQLLVTIQQASQAEIDAYNTADLELGMLVYNTDENRVFEYTDEGFQQILISSDIGSSVYTGFFIIDNTTLTATGTYAQSITGLPFEPSQITFVAHPNIGSFDINDDNATGDNNSNLLENTHGTMNGFARSDAGAISQAVIYVGAHGNSVNDITRYSNDAQCIGMRYTTQNGDNNGVIAATLTSFDTDGFTLDVTYTLGTFGNAGVQDDILDEAVIVLYTAYR